MPGGVRWGRGGMESLPPIKLSALPVPRYALLLRGQLISALPSLSSRLTFSLGHLSAA